MDSQQRRADAKLMRWNGGRCRLTFYDFAVAAAAVFEEGASEFFFSPGFVLLEVSVEEAQDSFAFDNEEYLRKRYLWRRIRVPAAIACSTMNGPSVLP